MAVHLTQKELAELIGKTDRHLRRLDEAQEPDKKFLGKTEDGKYDAATFVQRWCDAQVNKIAESLGDLDAIKAKHEIVKTEKTQLEVAKMRGELLDFRDVRKAWGDIANTTMRSLLNVPGQVAPIIRGMDDLEMISNAIDGEIRQALEAIANTPLPSYATEAAEEKEKEG